MGDDKNSEVDFDAVMQGLGVRPLDKAKAPAKRPVKTVIRRRARVDAPAEVAAPTEAPQAPKQASAAEEAEIARLQGANQGLEDQAAGMKAEIDALRDQVRELDVHRRSLQRRMAELDDTAKVPPPVALSDVLSGCGIKGPTEARKVLTALMDARQLEGLLGGLVAADAPSTARFLEDRVAVVCGGEYCPVPSGQVAHIVKPERCEVCGGSDVQRAVRRFVDACLMNGWTRVVIVGGSPRYHRQLRHLVQHRSLTLDLIPGDIRRTKAQAQADLRRAGLVVIWGGSILDHATSQLYKEPTADQATVVVVSHRGIIGMLKKVVERLD